MPMTAILPCNADPSERAQSALTLCKKLHAAVNVYAWCIVGQFGFLLLDTATSGWAPSFWHYTILWQMIVIYPLLGIAVMAWDARSRRRIEPFLMENNYLVCPDDFQIMREYPEAGPGFASRCPECGLIMENGNLARYWKARRMLSRNLNIMRFKQ